MCVGGFLLYSFYEYVMSKWRMMETFDNDYFYPSNFEDNISELVEVEEFLQKYLWRWSCNY